MPERLRRAAAFLNNALDTEPPIVSFVKSMLIGGGPVNAVVMPIQLRHLHNENH